MQNGTAWLWKFLLSEHGALNTTHCTCAGDLSTILTVSMCCNSFTELSDSIKTGALCFIQSLTHSFMLVRVVGPRITIRAHTRLCYSIQSFIHSTKVRFVFFPFSFPAFLKKEAEEDYMQDFMHKKLTS